MDCKRASRHIDAYAAGELIGNVALEVAEHVESCEHCRKAALDCMKMRDTIYAAGQKDAPAPDAAFFTALSRRLDSAVQAPVSPPAAVRTLRLAPVRWHVIGGVAAAAAAVFVISVYVIPVSFDKTPAGSSAASAGVSPAASVAPSPLGSQAWRTSGPGLRKMYNPYVTVSAYDNQPSVAEQDIYGALSPQPRFVFPRQARPIAGTAPSDADSLTKADYERLASRLAELETRVRTLEQTQPASSGNSGN